MTIHLRARRRRLRLPLVGVPLISVAVLICGWSVLWLFARHEAAVALDALIAREAEHGRILTCPERTIGGFPLGIDVTCAHPTFSGKIGGRDLEGSLGGLRAEIYLYQPSAIDVFVDGPAVVRSAGQPAEDPVDTTLSWSGLHVGLRILSPEQARIAVDIAEPQVTRPEGKVGEADHAELHLGPAAGRPLSDHAYDVWFTLTGVVIDPLDGLTETKDRLDIDEKAIVSHLAVGDLPWGPPMAEAWRQAGGTIELSNLTLAKGALSVTTSGSLALDEQHRPAGRLQAKLSDPAGLAGFGPLTRNLGLHLPLPGLASLSLPIILADGQVSVSLYIKTFRTGIRLPQLY